MVHNTEHVSVNTMESFLFILFLLMFAIVAAGYVWIEGSKNEARKKSKLILDCIMILTSVVPPELPMELSLAVNTSLIQLSKFAIFCTEPFRIPFAGKVDICCFDKTGTLTSENLVVKGVAGVGKDPQELFGAKDVPHDTIMVLASAHALVQLEDGTVVGDPMEKATVEEVGYRISNDVISPVQGKGDRIHVRRRFQFASALKRMSVVVTVGDTKKHLATVKGAPEVIQGMCTSTPDWYNETYQAFSKRGQRVLALAYKHFDKTLSKEQINHLHRDQVECDLIFAGFLVFHNPLKKDTLGAIRALNASSHRVVMITGDNPLTACHVAREVEIVDRDCLILDVVEGEDQLMWKDIHDKVSIPQDALDTTLPPKVLAYDLCLTGRALALLEGKSIIHDLISHVWVYARVSPSQKEYILIEMKMMGYTTLMCGDGTNDVGALKHAHIGVALLDGTPEDLEKIAARQRIDRLKTLYDNQKQLSVRFNLPVPPPPPAIAHLYPQTANAVTNGPNRQTQQATAVAESLLGDLEDDVPTIKFGDASVAAPFTSKLSSIESICIIVRQGRCTLVATIQMYKILALNCLISAFSLSALYLDGIKYGDYQVTISGMLMAVCFLSISRAKPLEKLSTMRPQSNIFNAYIMTSVIGQFAIHIASLLYVVVEAKTHATQPPLDFDKEFEPTLLNSAVYLISLSMQISTFAINYQGHPFRESLRENKMLFNSIRIVGFICVAAVTEMFPDLNSFLQLVPFPSKFRNALTMAVFVDFCGCFLLEKVSFRLFANSKPKDIVRHNN